MIGIGENPQVYGRERANRKLFESLNLNDFTLDPPKLFEGGGELAKSMSEYAGQIAKIQTRPWDLLSRCE